MSSEASDMLLTNPFLSYINQILLEEDDDAACMMPVVDSSYHATFSGFSEILAGQHSQPNCGHLPELHVNLVNPRGGFDNMPHEPGNLGPSGLFLPNNGHSSHHERAEVDCGMKHDSGFQGHVMPSHTPLNTAQFPELHEMQNSVNDGVLTDVAVSGWGQDAAAEGISDHRCMQGQEQGNDIFKLPITDEELSLRLAEVELSFEDLKLNNVYSDLYASSSASSTGASREGKHSGDKKVFLAGKGRKTGKTGTQELGAFVDVREVLLSCAQAVAIGDAKTANEILRQLCQAHGASANGTPLQRIAHFFSKALAARMRGIGEHQYRAMCYKMPSAVTLLQATKVGFELIPYVKVIHYYANLSILKAAEGASRLHIVDFGLMYGIQWPCLISALADREGGPPSLVITGIELPQPGINPAKRLEKSGQQLASYAKTYNVPFQYHAIVSDKWEDLDVASLNLHKGEVLVVNCIKCLRRLSDECVNLVLTTSPRQKLLTFMRSLNPHLLLTAVTNAAYNAPFFVSRVREALHHFSNSFDMLDTLWGDSPQRHMLERSCFYREILNIVGCEGAERVERPEPYKQWQVRITEAGFEQLPILSTIVSKSRSHVKQHYHKDFLIYDDGKGWMLMGWKGCTALGVSAWKPRLV